MADYSVTYGETTTTDTTNQRSPAIWGDCNWLDIERGEKPGESFYDSFLGFPLAGTQTTQIGFSQYKLYANTSDSISGVSAVNSVDLGGGILDFNGSNAGGDNTSLAQAYPTFKITGDTTTGKLWFEARVAITSTLTNHVAFFLGLAETNLFTLAAAVPFSSNTGTAPTNAGALIGFSKPAANTTTANTVYNDRATSFTAVGTADVTGLANFTFTKLGMKYDPLDPQGKHLRFFQDNVELSHYLTNTTISALSHLNANSLGFLFTMVAGSAASSDHCYLDWIRIAQYGAGIR